MSTATIRTAGSRHTVEHDVWPSPADGMPEHRYTADDGRTLTLVRVYWRAVYTLESCYQRAYEGLRWGWYDATHHGEPAKWTWIGPTAADRDQYLARWLAGGQ